MDKEKIALRFERFAINECKGSSELYEFLSWKIANDNELLEIASHARTGQPVPNLLFGAVQYLLLKGKQHPLKKYYEHDKINLKITEDAFHYFRDFCLLYKDEIISLLQNKYVQTNEVRRCSYLYPSFCFIYQKIRKPLSLIEIGTSAGLQLLWDKYCYDYGTNERFGNVDSDIEIKADIRGENKPFFLPTSPPVAERIGLDLHVNDVTNEEDYLWLRALIWPEHQERVALFDKASLYLKKQPVTLIEGDGIALLPHIIEQVPTDTAICIFHTHVANQLSKDAKEKLIDTIKDIGKERDVFHLYNNIWDAHLHLDYFIDSKEYNETVAETDAHARWFNWKLSMESNLV